MLKLWLALGVWMMAGLDATGTWTIELDPDFSGHQSTAACTFKQEGRKLTGSCGDETPVMGEVDERRVRWTLKTGTQHDVTATFTAVLDERGATMQGTWSLDQRTGNFEARKQ